MQNLLVHQVEKKIKSLNYEWYDSGKPYTLNIIGVRTSNTDVEVFNDFLFLIYRNEYSQWVLNQYQVTTDPGYFYLKNPMNVKGTAILVPNQYKETYAIGMHKGKYEALVQKYKPVLVYRDNNKNNIIDKHPEYLDEGYFGINIHKSSDRWDSRKIGRWSAGCTVFKRSKDFDEFMRVLKKHKSIYSNKFTYTLIQE